MLGPSPLSLKAMPLTARFSSSGLTLNPTLPFSKQATESGSKTVLTPPHRLGNLQSVVNLPYFDQVYYLAEANSASDVSLVLALPPALRARVFAVEFEPVTCCGDSVAVTRTLLHPAGIKSLGVSGKFKPSQSSQELLFTQYAMDIDYTYGLANAVAARTVVNKQRGVVPA